MFFFIEDKKRKSSVYYRGALNAKPATILNNKVLGQEHKNSHHCACNVKMTMEFGARWRKYVKGGKIEWQLVLLKGFCFEIENWNL